MTVTGTMTASHQLSSPNPRLFSHMALGLDPMSQVSWNSAGRSERVSLGSQAPLSAATSYSV